MYVPTGTMSNQVALRTHTEPGDVVLAARNAHIDNHELGAPYVLSGITMRFLPTTSGTFSSQAVREAVPVVPDSMPASLFQPVTLVCTENTHNAAGGTVWPVEQLDEVLFDVRAGQACSTGGAVRVAFALRFLG